jgi:hypothetical protein
MMSSLLAAGPRSDEETKSNEEAPVPATASFACANGALEPCDQTSATDRS